MTESPGVLFERLLDVMARLRAPAGCPWDRAQTRASLKPYLIEEAYEVLEAIETGNRAELEEELGDVLFSLVNVARLSSIDAEEALQGAIEKFRRRFAELEADLSAQGKSVGALPQDELERSWESVKAHERRRAEP